METAAYLEAALPTPAYVYGVRLKPFSIGHFLILSRINSKLFSGDVLKTDEPELKTAVLICAQDWDNAREFIWSKELQDQGVEWARKIEGKKFDFLEEFLKFDKYVSSALEHPRIWGSDSEGESIGCDWTESIIVSLVALLGYSESDAMNMHIPLARRRVLTFWELKSHRKILVNQTDLDTYKKALEVHERIKRKLCLN